MAPARIPAATASAKGMPSASAAASAPTHASPAPVVSATSPSVTAGQWPTSAPDTHAAPCAPSVTTMWRGPMPRSARAIPIASVGVAGAGRPRVSPASVSLTTRTSTCASVAGAVSRAGARLSRTRAPCECAHSMAAAFASAGTSACRTTTSEDAGINEALAGSVVTAAFAPASRMIVFSPEAATVISAVPDGPSTARRWVTSTPCEASSSRSRWPDGSDPTAPTNSVVTPECAAAAA